MGTIAPGSRVSVAPYISTPYTLCSALSEQPDLLAALLIDHPVSLFPWFERDDDIRPQITTFFATPADREPVNSGHLGYVPVGRWRENEVPEGLAQEPDAYLVSTSPPDQNGYCSFGPGVWFSPSLCRGARSVIAEVREDYIRTGGTNFVHVSQIDYFVEARRQAKRVQLPSRREDEQQLTEVISALVASELVNDRDTLQIGVGTVSAALALYLDSKSDLGIHTEIITGGIADLVAKGVVTGKYKTLHPRKVTGSALIAMRREEMELIDGNPTFELYEFGYANDIRLSMRQDNLVAINNALTVDLTGQVASETIGTRIWSGVGGQTAFAIAAQYSRGGRSISVLPSSHMVDGQLKSRIVPMLPEGTVVTVPRTFVDYVATEHGIATLRGKTVRERVGELIAVAHPDLRAELLQQAGALYAL